MGWSVDHHVDKSNPHLTICCYTLVIYHRFTIAIENGRLLIGVFHVKMMIFHSSVSLPEGISIFLAPAKSRNGFPSLTWWLNLHLCFDVHIISWAWIFAGSSWIYTRHKQQPGQLNQHVFSIYTSYSWRNMAGNLPWTLDVWGCCIGKMMERWIRFAMFGTSPWVINIKNWWATASVMAIDRWFWEPLGIPSYPLAN